MSSQGVFHMCFDPWGWWKLHLGKHPIGAWEEESIMSECKRQNVNLLWQGEENLGRHQQDPGTSGRAAGPGDPASLR